MKIDVLMLAFMDGEIRTVDVPDAEASGKDEASLLGLVFHYGQNDFQPVAKRCSVSVGDVIELHGKHHLVMPIGFSEMNTEELELYKLIPRRDRGMYAYGRQERV